MVMQLILGHKRSAQSEKGPTTCSGPDPAGPGWSVAGAQGPLEEIQEGNKQGRCRDYGKLAFSVIEVGYRLGLKISFFLGGERGVGSEARSNTPLGGALFAFEDICIVCFIICRY